MGRKFQRPSHPNTGRTNPFVDEEGNNPFSGENSENGDDNLFSATNAESVREYQASDFETVLPHRGKLIFWLGVVGMILSGLGVIGAIATVGALLGMFDGGWIALLGPCAFYALLPNGIAWMLGYQDARAIRVGAMSDAGRVSTSRGLLLGQVGTLASVLTLLAMLLIFLSSIAP